MGLLELQALTVTSSARNFPFFSRILGQNRALFPASTKKREESFLDSEFLVEIRLGRILRVDQSAWRFLRREITIPTKHEKRGIYEPESFTALQIVLTL